MKTMLKSTFIIGTAALAFTACSKAEAPSVQDAADKAQAAAKAAVDHSGHNSAALMSHSYPVINSGGHELGTVTINDVENGVNLILDITSIPAGPHAIHFHQTGACDTPDFTSSGGHYNPKSVEHGHIGTSGPHAGDMENFNAPQSGVVKLTIPNPQVSLSDRHEFSPLLDADGTALVIHAGADDYKSQPSGAAGARIACAVISK